MWSNSLTRKGQKQLASWALQPLMGEDKKLLVPF